MFCVLEGERKRIVFIAIANSSRKKLIISTISRRISLSGLLRNIVSSSTRFMIRTISES